MNEPISRRKAIQAAGAAAALAAGGPFLMTARGQEPGWLEPRPARPVTSLATYGLGAGWDGEQYVLPDLPYANDALEPFLGAQTLEIHRGRHHQGYVGGLNRTLERLKEARQADEWQHIRALSRDLAFHGSGHMLHVLYWGSMAPGGAEMPDELAGKVQEDFGSADALVKHFAAASKDVMSNGWGVLVYEPLADKLLVMQVERHQDLAIWGVVPLMVCDVWEHAYYLDYQNNRGQYVDRFMEHVNWPFAARRLQQAVAQRQQQQQPAQ